MRCYHLSANFEAGAKLVQKYVGTQADVRQTKEEWSAAYGIKKTAVSVVEVDVPMEKAKLIGFLNDILEKNS